jgi:hypothetical protein
MLLLFAAGASASVSTFESLFVLATEVVALISVDVTLSLANFVPYAGLGLGLEPGGNIRR